MTSQYTLLFNRYLKQSNEKVKAIEVLLEYLKGHPVGDMLDYGCGTGAFIEAVLPYCNNIFAMDNENRLPKHLLHHDHVKFIKGDLLNSDFQQTFDAILAAYVLWEIPFSKWDFFFKKCKQLLNTNRVMIVIDTYTESNFDNPFFSFNKNLQISTDYPKWHDYLRSQNITFESHPFTSQIKAKDEEEMYRILEFFFQTPESQDFYNQNSEKILTDFKSKKTAVGIAITMQHSMDILYLNQAKNA